MVGDPGAGKTCILRALRSQLPASGFRLEQSLGLFAWVTLRLWPERAFGGIEALVGELKRRLKAPVAAP